MENQGEGGMEAWQDGERVFGKVSQFVALRLLPLLQLPESGRVDRHGFSRHRMYTAHA